jgi:hypothetical protein
MANELRRAETSSPRNLRPTVFEIPDAELAHADTYEVAAYLRVKAPLAGPQQREASNRLMAPGGQDESRRLSEKG